MKPMTLLETVYNSQHPDSFCNPIHDIFPDQQPTQMLKSE